MSLHLTPIRIPMQLLQLKITCVSLVVLGCSKKLSSDTGHESVKDKHGNTYAVRLASSIELPNNIREIKKKGLRSQAFRKETNQTTINP